MSLFYKIFENIYKKKIWTDSNLKNPPSYSGPGSYPKNAEIYLKFLKLFIDQNNITSVVDYGCGDLGLYNNFSWTNIDYLGIDVSSEAIRLAKLLYKQKVKLLCQDTFDLPSADLLIVKDVFGHWEGKKNDVIGLGDKLYLITDFLDRNINKFKFILICDGIEGIIEKYFPINFKFKKYYVDFSNKKKILYFSKKSTEHPI